MTTIRKSEVLYSGVAAGTGAWFRLDSRYDTEQLRVLQITLATGDTITIEGTTKDVRGSTEDAVKASITNDDIVTIGTFTSSGGNTLYGPYTYIRAKKTGTTGYAKVQGML